MGTGVELVQLRLKFDLWVRFQFFAVKIPCEPKFFSGREVVEENELVELDFSEGS